MISTGVFVVSIIDRDHDDVLGRPSVTSLPHAIKKSDNKVIVVPFINCLCVKMLMSELNGLLSFGSWLTQ